MKLHPNQLDPRGRGFTLMEILVALGILAIGLTAVAAIFPTAIYLQREATHEALRQQHVRSADASLQGKGLSGTTLYQFTENESDGTMPESNPAFAVFALAQVDVDVLNAAVPDVEPPGVSSADSMLNEWSVLDRSYPSITPDPSVREFFWVPLVRRGVEANEYINDWRVYAFVMQKMSQGQTFDPADSPATHPCANPWDPDWFPKVYRIDFPSSAVGADNKITLPNRWDGTAAPGDAAQMIQVGDMVLGDNGLIFRVAAADGGSITVNDEAQYNPENGRDLTGIWYARPDAPGEASPVRDIRVLSNNVTRLEDPTP